MIGLRARFGNENVSKLSPKKFLEGEAIDAKLGQNALCRTGKDGRVRHVTGTEKMVVKSPLSHRNGVIYFDYPEPGMDIKFSGTKLSGSVTNGRL